jgi:hypothetical protein
MLLSDNFSGARRKVSTNFASPISVLRSDSRACTESGIQTESGKQLAGSANPSPAVCR